MKTGESVTATIFSEQLFSDFKLPVKAGEEYEITCDGNQRWKDWFRKSSPKGFFNLAAIIAGLRVKGVKCFCLCGCYNDELSSAFAIGIFKKLAVERDGFVSFFANDAEGYYENNKGSVVVEAKLLKMVAV